MLETTLSPVVRLALAYASRATRPVYLATFALDARMNSLIAAAREPLLAQLKLAWWRDRLAQPAAERPSGEPVLAALAVWPQPVSPLHRLIDGWEAYLLAEDRAAGLAQLASGRAELGAGLAAALGCSSAADAAAAALRAWTLAEHGADPGQADFATLPRALRPIALLAGLAHRSGGKKPLLDGPLALAAGMRIGMIGR